MNSIQIRTALAKLRDETIDAINANLVKCEEQEIDMDLYDCGLFIVLTSAYKVAERWEVIGVSRINGEPNIHIKSYDANIDEYVNVVATDLETDDLIEILQAMENEIVRFNSN